jgi:hypothetical protein
MAKIRRRSTHSKLVSGQNQPHATPGHCDHKIDIDVVLRIRGADMSLNEKPVQGKRAGAFCAGRRNVSSQSTLAEIDAGNATSSPV